MQQKKQRRVIQGTCAQCGGSFSTTDIYKKFCNSSCAAKFNNSNRGPLSPETKNKISESVVRTLRAPDRVKVARPVVTPELAKVRREARRATADEKVMSAEWESLGWDSKRRRVLIEQEHKCASCGIDRWNGRPLSLEVDHRNGDRADNRRENLCGLCPNCHSQTETWRGRKLRGRNYGPQRSDADMLEAFRRERSVVGALRSLGLHTTGGNHTRLTRLVTLYALDLEATNSESDVL